MVTSRLESEKLKKLLEGEKKTSGKLLAARDKQLRELKDQNKVLNKQIEALKDNNNTLKNTLGHF